jgi:hypothetical protein
MLSPLEFARGDRGADAFNIGHRQRRTAVRLVPALKQFEHDDGINAAPK